MSRFQGAPSRPAPHFRGLRPRSTGWPWCFASPPLRRWPCLQAHRPRRQPPHPMWSVQVGATGQWVGTKLFLLLLLFFLLWWCLGPNREAAMGRRGWYHAGARVWSHLISFSPSPSFFVEPTRRAPRAGHEPEEPSKLAGVFSLPAILDACIRMHACMHRFLCGVCSPSSFFFPFQTDKHALRSDQRQQLVSATLDPVHRQQGRHGCHQHPRQCTSSCKQKNRKTENCFMCFISTSIFLLFLPPPPQKKIKDCS